MTTSDNLSTIPGETLSVGLVVCGPCACGKSEVASALANHFQVPFVDADSFHTESNIKKMSSGVALTDEDRLPWLLTVRQEMTQVRKQDFPNHRHVSVVAACSALKTKYRDILRGAITNSTNLPTDSYQLPVIFVFLKCSEAVLQTRLNERQGHFMKSNMLTSQLAILEIPQGSEQNHCIIVNGDAPLNIVLQEITEKLEILYTKN